MVVIAIVAILAGVAMPAYKTYIIKAKMGSANEFLTSQADAAIRYYSEHSVFPNAQELGFTTIGSGNNHQTPIPQDADEYITKNIAFLNIEPRVSTCPSGIVAATLGNFNGGDFDVEAQGATYAELYYLIIDLDGIVNKFCQYAYYVDNEVVSGNYISNCSNYADYPERDQELIDLTNSCS